MPDQERTSESRRENRLESMALLFLYALMGSLTFLNLLFSNTIPQIETCGLIHPLVFQAQVSFINPNTSVNFSTGFQDLPLDIDAEDLDTVLRVYGASPLSVNSRPLRFDDDVDVDNDLLNSAIYHLENDTNTRQTYYIEVATYADSKEGNYILQVVESVPPILDPEQQANLSEEETLSLFPEIRVGDTIPAILENGEVDRYVFIGTDEDLQLSVAGTTLSGDELDTILRVYDSTRETIVIQNDDDVLSKSSFISGVPVQDGDWYIIEVEGLNETVEAEYTLSIEPVAPSLPIEIGSEVAGDIEERERDRYTLDLEPEQGITVELASEEFDTYLLIEDSEGNEIAVNDNAGTTSNSVIPRFSVQEAQTITIQVISIDGRSGNYTLNVVASETDGSDTTIRLGETVEGGLELGERTRYRVELDATADEETSYSFFIESNFDSLLRVLDATDDTELAFSDDFTGLDAGIPQFTPPEGITSIIIEVASFADSDSGTYTLIADTADNIQIPTDTSEAASLEGIDIIEADAVTAGDIIEGELDREQRIRYALDVVPSAFYNVVTFSEDFDTFLRIYDADGIELAFNDDFDELNAAINNFGVDEAQTVTIEIASFDDSEGGDYQLSISEVAVLEGGIVTADSTTEGELTNQRVRYDLDVTPDLRYSIAIDSNFDSYLRIYDADNTEIAFNDDFDDLDAAISNFSVSEPQVITIEVASFADSESGDYELIIETVIPPEPINIEIGQDIKDVVEIGERIPYSIDVQANTIYDFVIDSDFDSALYIFGENGEELAYNDLFFDLDAAVMGFSTEETQTLIIEVGSYEDGEGGEYEFIAAIAPETPDPIAIQAGDTVSGDLLNGQGILYELDAQARAEYFIEADSDDFDVELFVYDLDGNPISANDAFDDETTTEANYVAPSNQIIFIEVASNSYTDAGEYELTVDAILPAESQTIDIEDGIEDQVLEDGQRLPYELEIDNNTAYDITIDSDFDSYLRIFDANTGDLLAENDDLDGLNAGILGFEADGRNAIIVEVASYSDSGSGTFSLTVEEGEPDERVEIDGRLATSERTDYFITLQADDPFSIYLDSDFDSYLRLYDESDEIITESDDANGLDAGIFNFELEEATMIRVEVASFNDSGGGDYTLIVEAPGVTSNDIRLQRGSQQDGINDDVSDIPEEVLDFASAIPIPNRELPYTHTGVLGINDSTFQIYRFPIEANQTNLRFDLVVDGNFDNILTVYDSNSNQLQTTENFADDENGIITNFSVLQEQTVYIVVSPASDIEAGQYTLRVEQAPIEVVSRGDIEVGTAEEGEIAANKREFYILQLRANTAVDILLQTNKPEEDFSSRLSRIWRTFSRNPRADNWTACLEYYGYTESIDSPFNIDVEGFSRFVLGRKNALEDECVENFSRTTTSVLLQEFLDQCKPTATIALTPLGRVLFFVVLPGLAILLPIMTVTILDEDKKFLWGLGIFFVGLFVLTSSLLYLHLGEVSAIVALQEFAYGLFGGTATGAAIAFISKALDQFSGKSQEVDQLQDMQIQYQESMIAMLQSIRSEGIYLADDDTTQITPTDGDPVADEPELPSDDERPSE